MLPLANLTKGYRMSRLRLHPEHHLVGRIGWLRAAVLGANDGIVSTASLIVGVAAATATAQTISYEVFMGIAVMGVVAVAGSFNMRDIVAAPTTMPAASTIGEMVEDTPSTVPSWQIRSLR